MGSCDCNTVIRGKREGGRGEGERGKGGKGEGWKGGKRLGVINGAGVDICMWALRYRSKALCCGFEGSDGCSWSSGSFVAWE